MEWVEPKGEYLLFLDSDDFFNENLLYKTVKAADNFLADCNLSI